MQVHSLSLWQRAGRSTPQIPGFKDIMKKPDILTALEPVIKAFENLSIPYYKVVL